MIAGTYNMTCDQGSTFTRTFVVQQQDSVDPNLYTAQNLTGYTARMQVRRTVDSTVLLAELTTGNGKIVINGALGQVIVSLTAAQTAAIESSGVYDVEIVSPSTEVHKIVRGAFNINLEVTR